MTKKAMTVKENILIKKALLEVLEEVFNAVEYNLKYAEKEAEETKNTLAEMAKDWDEEVSGKLEEDWSYQANQRNLSKEIAKVDAYAVVYKKLEELI